MSRYLIPVGSCLLSALMGAVVAGFAFAQIGFDRGADYGASVCKIAQVIALKEHHK